MMTKTISVQKRNGSDSISCSDAARQKGAYLMSKSVEHQVPGYEVSKARIDAPASQLIVEKGKIYLLSAGIFITRTRDQIVIRSLTSDEVATKFALNTRIPHCRHKFDIETGKWFCEGTCREGGGQVLNCEGLISKDGDVFACACLPI